MKNPQNHQIQISIVQEHGMEDKMGAFYETKIFFLESLGRPVANYEEWMNMPSRSRAAGLYLAFYNEIMTAWNKTKSFYTLEEDGVSCILQYLEKNQPIIENDINKFSPRYIYRVAFNCLYCICHDIKRDKQRWETETSNIVSAGEDEIDLFDNYVGGNAQDSDVERARKALWDSISILGDEGEKVVYHLINGSSLGKTRKNSASYSQDRLRDISVSRKRADEIIQILKIILEPFKDDFYR